MHRRLARRAVAPAVADVHEWAGAGLGSNMRARMGVGRADDRVPTARWPVVPARVWTSRNASRSSLQRGVARPRCGCFGSRRREPPCPAPRTQPPRQSRSSRGCSSYRCSSRWCARGARVCEGQPLERLPRTLTPRPQTGAGGWLTPRAVRRRRRGGGGGGGGGAGAARRRHSRRGSAAVPRGAPAAAGGEAGRDRGRPRPRRRETEAGRGRGGARPGRGETGAGRARGRPDREMWRIARGGEARGREREGEKSQSKTVSCRCAITI